MHRVVAILTGVLALTVAVAGPKPAGVAWRFASPGSGNTPPIASAGADQTAPVGATVHLSASGSSDVDGDALTFQWSLQSRPAGSVAALSDPASVSPFIVVDRPGTYVVRLIVNDGQADSARALWFSRRLTVRPVTG